MESSTLLGSCYKKHIYILNRYYLHVNVMDVRFKVPANFYVSGQSQSGKSFLIRQLLQHSNELFYPVPTKIIYCYGEYQKEFEELCNVDFNLVEGFPSNLDDLTKGHDQSIVVLDDLMGECSKDQREGLITKAFPYFILRRTYFHQENYRELLV